MVRISLRCGMKRSLLRTQIDRLGPLQLTDGSYSSVKSSGPTVGSVGDSGDISQKSND